jgi:GNAT superfamily N-acetyltransferase
MNKEDSLIIKKVNADLFEDFLGLVNKLAEFEKLSPPNEEAKRRLRQDCLSYKPKFHAAVGIIKSKCVSYVIYFFTYSSFLALPTLYLEDIFVLDDHRGQGVGKKMFSYCKKIAKDDGCGRMEFTVLNWNTSAQEFYKKHKAKPLNDWLYYRVVREDF